MNDSTTPQPEPLPSTQTDIDATRNQEPVRSPVHESIPTSIGGFAVIRCLGEGGMGRIYEGTDPLLGRSVAIKVMLPHVAKNEEFRKRFLREARSQASIHHPHIVPVWQVGEDRDVPFIIMPLLRGETLESRLKREGRLPIEEAVRIGIEIAEGLRAAHEQGLIHRDVKPSNVWLSAPTGQVLLLDFGLARLATSGSDVTNTGGVLGTPSYMSPEQADGAEVDPRSDLFSLGVVLFRLVAGQLPFQANSVPALLRCIVEKPPEPLIESIPDLPPAFVRLVQELLAKKPSDRPPSAYVVVTRLRASLDDRSKWVAPRTKPTNRRKIRFAVGLGIVLVGLLVWGFLPKSSPGLVVKVDDSKPAVDNRTVIIRGGGTTFLAPLMESWATVYERERGVRIGYEGLGSGKGIANLVNRKFPFSCTEAYLTDEQLNSLRKEGRDMLHVPLAMGAVVPTYNLPMVTKPLRFTGPVLASIFLGKITHWDDPALLVSNPGVEMPHLPIVVVHREDSSGTTFIWTDYLSKVSGEWRDRVGAGLLPRWPVGTGGKGNSGVSDKVSREIGSLGYVELTYALENNLQLGSVRNRAGKYITPNLESLTAAARSLEQIPQDLRYTLTDAPGEASYPIVGTAWAVIDTDQTMNEAGRELIDFLRWATREGQSYSRELLYAPLPSELVERIGEQLNRVRLK